MKQKEIIKKSMRYFWLKLEEGFFGDPKIKKLRRLPGGDKLAIIYLELMLLSIRNEGFLVYEGLEETFEKELSLKIDEDEESILLVVNFLRQYNLLIEVGEPNNFLLAQESWSIGSESQSNRYKKQQKNSEIGKIPPKFHQNSTKIPTDIDIEKDIDKDIELDVDSIEEDECTDNNQAFRLSFFKGEIGKGIVISDEQFDALCTKLSLDELHIYMEKMSALISKGYKFSCSHYQYILKMVEKDRKV